MNSMYSIFMLQNGTSYKKKKEIMSSVTYFVGGCGSHNHVNKEQNYVVY